jgi:hypothetical protein
MPKNPKDPKKPKRGMSGFMFFAGAMRGPIKKEHPDWGIGQIGKELGKRWGVIKDCDKVKYEAMAKKDKERYDKAMKSYKPSKDFLEKLATFNAKKPKKKKDPNAPKRGLSSYMFFVKDFGKGLREKNPSWGVAEVGKELGKRWGEMSNKDKSKYTQLAAKDKERYEKEKSKYCEMASAKA